MTFRVHKQGKQILGVGDADDIVPGVLIDGDSGMPCFHDGARHVADRRAGRHTVKVGPGGHDILHLHVVQAQNAQDHRTFFRVKLTLVAGLKNGLLQRVA